jgi:hypothetical protein
MKFRLESGGPTAATLPGGGRRPVGARPLLAFLMLLVLLVQGTAVQTHVHWARQVSESAAASRGSIQAANPAQGDSSADCPLCREAAMAGAYILPPAVVLPPPPAAVLWIATAMRAAFGVLTSAHSWQSRAPPQ